MLEEELFEERVRKGLRKEWRKEGRMEKEKAIWCGNSLKVFLILCNSVPRPKQIGGA